MKTSKKLLKEEIEKMIKLFNYETGKSLVEQKLNEETEQKLGSPLDRNLGFNPKNGFRPPGRKDHNGIDYYAESGTKALAIADGVVVKTAEDSPRCGGLIVIDHGEFRSGYCHMKEIDVRENENVTKGQIIGLTGGAKGDKGRGNSTGAHLHFTLKKNGLTVNPDLYLNNEYTNTSSVSSESNVSTKKIYDDIVFSIEKIGTRTGKLKDAIKKIKDCSQLEELNNMFSSEPVDDVNYNDLYDYINSDIDFIDKLFDKNIVEELVELFNSVCSNSVEEIDGELVKK